MRKSFTTGITDWALGNDLLRNLEQGTKAFGSTEQFQTNIPKAVRHKNGIRGLIERTLQKKKSY